MFKVTPNPPVSSGIESIDPQAADRALAHYIPTEGKASKPAVSSHLSTFQNQEEVLVDVSSILGSAAATAYENADNLTGPHRKVAMGVVHLIELAQGRLDSMIDERLAVAPS